MRRPVTTSPCRCLARPKSLALTFQIENRSAATASYKIGHRDFELPPRHHTRTHEQCRPTHVVFELPVEGKNQTVEATDGSRFAITQDGKVIKTKPGSVSGRR